jgi:aminoglycoside phosphotransferase (APT) family kinase protein
VPGDELGGGLLSKETAIVYLAQRGAVPGAENAVISQLSGGVSNVVLAADCGATRVVLKQALPRLRVKDLWLAKRERAISEADALVLARTVTPDAVPAVLDVDRERCALTIESAPSSWVTWKSRLLAGDVDPEVGARLGETLAKWHGATFGDALVAERFADYEAFDQLRVDPFHRTVSARRPELAVAIAPLVAQMEATHVCLVHGDYSPKNVLVGDGMWVIDFEVAHFGDPVFDLAFMLNHLLLKLLHLPCSASALESSAAGFWEAYGSRVPECLLPDAQYLLGHVGALMVARVDGKSPVEYLTRDEQDLARELGSSLLLDPPASLSDALAMIRSAAR